MRLRDAGTCADCGTNIAKDEWAGYDPTARAVRCIDHGDASETPDLPRFDGQDCCVDHAA